MSRHTFVCSAGRRLDIQPCKTSPGLVQIQILGADRQPLASCTVPPSTASLIAQAFEVEATAGESVERALQAVRNLPDECGCGDQSTCKAKKCMGREIETAGRKAAFKVGMMGDCECAASRHVGAFKPPCTCHENRLERFAAGGPVVSALPVIQADEKKGGLPTYGELRATWEEGKCCATPRPDCMGMLLDGIGNRCAAMRAGV